MTLRIELKYKLLLMKKGIVIVLAFGLFLGCSSATKVPQNAETVAAFTSFVKQKTFQFRANTAYPMITQAFNSVANSGILPPGSASGAIQLIGISSFIKVYGDSVSGNLPFYGERQFGGGLTSNAGIEFKGIPKTYSQTYNEAKNRYDIAFEIADKMERHQVNITLFPNMSANVSVNSNQRDTIRYVGTVAAIESDKKE
ncbi:MAG: hypothetical protein ACJAUQ_002030 [Maribacter sp.]|jgi:hypothetical protein